MTTRSAYVIRYKNTYSRTTIPKGCSVEPRLGKLYFNPWFTPDAKAARKCASEKANHDHGDGAQPFASSYDFVFYVNGLKTHLLADPGTPGILPTRIPLCLAPNPARPGHGNVSRRELLKIHL